MKNSKLQTGTLFYKTAAMAAVWLILFCPGLSSGNDLDEIVLKIQQCYDAIEDFQAKFVQESMVKSWSAAQVQKARVEVEKTNTRIDQAMESIQIELKNVHLRLLEAKERISAALKSTDTAQRAFDVAEVRVENGLATQVELKDSRVSLDRAKLNYYAAIYDYLNAYFDWEQSTGKVKLAGF